LDPSLPINESGQVAQLPLKEVIDIDGSGAESGFARMLTYHMSQDLPTLAEPLSAVNAKEAAL
jgi:hypothetical protein